MSSNVATLKDIITSFNAAVINIENANDDGSINWDFVDADINMDASEAGVVLPEDYYTTFNDLADKFEAGLTAVAATELNLDPTRPAYIKETL